MQIFSDICEMIDTNDRFLGIRSATDYYPFGQQMPGRSFNSSNYKFGFNGKLMDNEVSGNGNQYDYGFRIYNPKIARFLSTDPLTNDYPWFTPYQFAGNSPIAFIDIDGLERGSNIYANSQRERLITSSYRDIQRTTTLRIVQNSTFNREKAQNQAKQTRINNNQEPVPPPETYNTDNPLFVLTDLWSNLQDVKKIIYQDFDLTTRTYSKTFTVYEFTFKTEEAKYLFIKAQNNWQKKYDDAMTQAKTEAKSKDPIARDMYIANQEMSFKKTYGESPKQQLIDQFKKGVDNKTVEVKTIEDYTKLNDVIYETPPATP
jgi:RHS repeat-associated protein